MADTDVNEDLLDYEEEENTEQVEWGLERGEGQDHRSSCLNFIGLIKAVK